MTKPTAASNHAAILDLQREVESLRSQFAEIPGHLRGAEPVPQAARDALSGGLTPPKAQRGGLQRPSCVNVRTCGNRCPEPGVALAEAIGWKCDPCKS